ncbi:MAG: DUF116 domain-containing protein [Nitrospiraceae bacterium]|nr:DUF116 domain-containing protein [Nitrospiraceae bacterium]
MKDGKNKDMKDRRLGDEWAGWDGQGRPEDFHVNETPRTFIWLAAVLFLVGLAFSFGGFYMIQPRLEQFSPSAPWFVLWLLIGAAFILAAAGVFWFFTVVKLKKSFLPSRWVERYVLFVLPKAVWLGSKLGISRDRVGNSFIKTHNRIIRSYAGKFSPERTMILLPRCLKPEVRKEIAEVASGDHFKIVTAVGGEEARRAIRDYRPTFILAVACERDLMSGLKDVAERVPVLAIPNQRPDGPCKNTSIPMEEFREAIAFIKQQEPPSLQRGSGKKTEQE